MRPHCAQALGYTITLLLALAGAVCHGVVLFSLLELAPLNNVFGSAVGIVTVVEIGWLVMLALYLISTMLAPKNAPFIWVITDVCLLMTLGTIGLGATVVLVIANYAHLDVCRKKKFGESCTASAAGGAISFVVGVALLASAITEAVYTSKIHGREGWWLSLRWLSHNTQGFAPLKLTVHPASMHNMAPAPRQARQGTFVPIIVVNDRLRKSKEYEDVPLLEPGSRRVITLPRNSHPHGSKRCATVDSDPSSGPLSAPSGNSDVCGDDYPFTPSLRRFSDRMEELKDDDKSTLRSPRVNPQSKKRVGVALNTWPWRPDSTASDESIETAV